LLDYWTQHVNDLPLRRGECSLTQKLLDYWTQHPEAQGTLEAIVEWWLLEQRIQQAAADVRTALSTLVAKGLVVEQRRPDGRIFYRLNREKQAKIRARLESGDTGGK
jgi:hypothetical protein